MAAGMSSQLQAFHTAFEEAKRELEGIRNSFNTDDDELLRQRRRSIDELLSNFQHDIDVADEMELGDNGYRKYSTRSNRRCKGSRCGERKLSQHELNKRIDMDDDLNEIAKLNLKYKGVSNKVKVFPIHSPVGLLTSNNKFKSILEKIEENNNRIGAIIQNAGIGDGSDINLGIITPADTSEKIELTAATNSDQHPQSKDTSFHFDNFDLKRKSRQKSDSFDLSKAKNLNLAMKRDTIPDDRSFAEVMQSIDVPSLANDQLDETKNDLSHEANYKLSKLEQDAAEKKKEMRWKGKAQDLVKRNINFNPMNEIKLKTSFRLMDHGFGPSLPSNSLTESRRMMKIDDILKRMEKSYEPDAPAKNEFEKINSMLSTDDSNVNVLKSRFKRLKDLSDQQLTDMGVVLQEASADENPSKLQLTRIKRISDTRDCDHLKSTDKKVDNKERANKRAGKEDSKKEPEKKTPPRVMATALAMAIADNNKSKRRVKRIDTFSDVSVNNIELADMTLDNDEAGRSRSKRSITSSRQKRFATTEDETLPENVDFDTMERNEDEMYARIKRGALAKAATMNVTVAAEAPLNVTIAAGESTKMVHKLQKRSVHVQDEVDNNSDSHKLTSPPVGKLAAGIVVKEDNGDDIRTSKKSLDETTFDFASAARTLGIDRFDNMKPKVSGTNVDGMTFDNLFNDDAIKVQPFNPNNTIISNDDNMQNIEKYHKNHASEYVSVKAKLTKLAKNHELPQNHEQHENHENHANQMKNHENNNANQKDNNNKKYNDNSNSKLDLHTIHTFVNNIEKTTDSNKRDSDILNDNKNNNSPNSNLNLNFDTNSNTNNNNKNNNNNNNNNNNPATNSINNNNNNNNNNNIYDNNNNPNVNHNNNNNINKSNKDNSNNSNKLMLALRDEILNCTAFTKLQNFLRDSTVDSASNKTSTSNAPSNQKISADISSNSMESTISVPQTPPNGISAGSPIDSGGNILSMAKNDDLMKLNITINASVMGEQNSSNFIGNGTINVRSSGNDLRERRGIIFPEYDSMEKRTCADIKESADIDKKLDNMVSGKLSTEVVSSMLGMVRDNPQLKLLWPALKSNHPSSKPQSNTPSNMRNPDNEAKFKDTENLLQTAMANVNDIIEQQVRERTCLPLRPDLITFYELILTTYKEQDNGRAKRESSFSLVNDFSKEVRAIDPSKIDEKSRIVKKLLRQYEDLPQEDQQQVLGMRDDLLMDLMYLRKLKDTRDMLLERRKRELMHAQQLNADDSELVKRLEADYTPAFLKLLKTSEIFKEATIEKD